VGGVPRSVPFVEESPPMRNLMIALACVVAVAGCGKKHDDETRYDTSRRTDDRAQPAPPRDADNTGVNKRDRDDSAITPGDQKENEADLKRTAEIRKRVV